MTWVVLGEQSGKIKLVSTRDAKGMIPKGSYLTIEFGETKFVLRVDDSGQVEPYSPSPLIVDMDLKPLRHDQDCRNVISAYRVKDLSKRTDGYVDFIPPQSVARRSNQEEIDLAIGGSGEGPRVFVATVHSSQNQILKDESGRPITAVLPNEAFFHQMLICGKTGSGKTVAAKYLAQYFIENIVGETEGAVLAVNVKDVDLLRMNRPSVAANPEVVDEWNAMGEKARGVSNYVVYYPATVHIDPSQGVDPETCTKITLDVMRIEPEALTGLLQGISDAGSQNLPSIFRFWREELIGKKPGAKATFGDFVRYFVSVGEEGRVFRTRNVRGDISEITMHRATYDNILRNLDFALDFFDNENAKTLDWNDILVPGKMSVVNVAGSKGIEFGSILLRDLLRRIVDAKGRQMSRVPILIIIDEVHQFYNSESSKEALDALDTICRTGRSLKIGVVFSSQNPSDIPRGLSSVINTKIFFKSDSSSVKSFGVRVTDEEMESLKKGYAIASIHDLSLLKVIKFPMSFSGVFETRR